MADRNDSLTVVTGITLRDWFAALALQGILAQTGAPRGASPDSEAQTVVKNCYVIADLMLKQRGK